MSGPYLFKSPVEPFYNIDLTRASNGTHYSGGFGSDETSRQFGLNNPFSSNTSAANASKMSGGRRGIRRGIGRGIGRGIRRKIKQSTKKNINRYNIIKMKRGLKSRRVKSRRSRSKRGRITRRHRRHRQRGGNTTYHQYGSQIPNSASYGINSVLNPNLSALANPIPIEKINGNCVDNYNHNTNRGFQFW